MGVESTLPTSILFLFSSYSIRTGTYFINVRIFNFNHHIFTGDLNLNEFLSYKNFDPIGRCMRCAWAQEYIWRHFIVNGDLLVCVNSALAFGLYFGFWIIFLRREREESAMSINKASQTHARNSILEDHGRKQKVFRFRHVERLHCAATFLASTPLETDFTFF